VIWQRIIRSTLNQIFDVRFVTVIVTALHPEQNTGNNRQWQDMLPL